MPNKYLDETGLAYFWGKIKAKITALAVPRVASSTDNAVPRFDGTGGALQNSGVTINDSGNMYFPASAYWGSASYLINASGNSKLNLLGLGGAGIVTGRSLNVEGSSYHKGAVYFNCDALDDATTYRVDANADARFRNIYSYRGRHYSYNESSSPSLFTSYTIGGSVTDSRDASGTGLVDTLPETQTFGSLIIRQPATRQTYENNVLQSTAYLNTQFWFRTYGVATSGTNAGKIISSYREDYALPACSNDLTASKTYNILTTKNTVSVAQGGTGATTFSSGEALIGAGSGAVTTRGIYTTSSAAYIGVGQELTTKSGVAYSLAKINNGTQNAGVGIYAPTSAGTAGYILKSSGGTAAPVWLQTLPVANGGTGKSSFNGGSVVVTNSDGTGLADRLIADQSNERTDFGNNAYIPTQRTILHAVEARLNRLTKVNTHDDQYTYYMARGEAFTNSSSTVPTYNGSIVWQYS